MKSRQWIRNIIFFGPYCHIYMAGVTDMTLENFDTEKTLVAGLYAV